MPITDSLLGEKKCIFTPTEPKQKKYYLHVVCGINQQVLKKAGPKLQSSHDGNSTVERPHSDGGVTYHQQQQDVGGSVGISLIPF